MDDTALDRRLADGDWPFDADRNDPLAALRVPVVTTANPGWKYEVCLMIDGSEDALWPSLRPDDTEVKQVAAYIEYRMEYYNAGWKAKMRRRPLDADGSTNTVVLRKRPDGGWCYRRRSWERGPMMVPVPGEVLTLEALLDRINDIVPEKWQAWKAAHLDAFGGTCPGGC
jgi:hypothetical protein